MNLPLPPTISPKQMTLLRIVCAMAWSDGELSSAEAELMLSHFSQLFASDPQQVEALRQELREYVSQNIPLTELVPQLQTEEDRELMLKLGYLVIQASQRTPDEPLINAEEKAAYRHLVELLALPEDRVTEIEQLEYAELQHHHGNVIQTSGDELRHFFDR